MGVVGFVFYCLMLLWFSQAAVLVSVVASKEKDHHCRYDCGNVSISYPFGIGTQKCYLDPSFEVTCDKTGGREKPFLKRLQLEMLYSDSQNVIVNHPVSYFNCGNDDDDGVTRDFNAKLKDTPFSFSTFNSFGSVGCSNLATLVSNGIPVSGCLQPGCDKGYCYINYMTENLHSLAVNITRIFPGVSQTNRCSSGFIFYSGFTYPEGVRIGTQYVPAMLEWNINCNSGDCEQPAAKSNRVYCNKTCGDMPIEFPFGIGANCYLNDWFKVSCHTTEKGIKKAFININNTSMQLLNTSFFVRGEVLVNNPITYSKCHNINDTLGFSVNLTGSPFFFSQTSNYFAYVGCGNLATLFHNETDPIGGCLQANCSSDDGTSSFDICDLSIPRGFSSFAANITQIYPNNGSNRSKCPSAFLIDQETSVDQINGTEVPVKLQFAQRKYGLCELKDGNGTNCNSDRKYCWTNLSPTHLCVCSYDFQHNAYGIDVCREIGKCSDPKYKICSMLCLNEPGNYCSPTSCPKGYEYDKIRDRCKPKVFPIKAILIGCCTSMGTLLVLLVTWWLYKEQKRRRNNKRKQRYFKNNGGLLLQQKMSINEDKIEKIRFFTSKELEKATDYYNENRIIGEGGQGTVYKGMLADGRIVAVKKPKMGEDRKKQFLDEKQVEQWINEVMILSQVNHRNVVKLLGCCLETRFPMLVYEFIPNGTLFQMIHDQSEEFPLIWDMRLRIAIEVTNSLAYLHSAASVPIYHRDIKSTNILLDDKYRAKVSDFGISKLIGLDQTHTTTQVQGTFGYLDPEYFRSNQFTEKSDVYSFGVVLAELLTGQKPFYAIQSEEEVRSLVHFFLLSMESSLFDILDPRVKNDGPEDEVVAVARLARRCLNLNGKKRPTMKQVAMELESIRAGRDEEQISDADEDSEDDCIPPWSSASCPTTSIVLSNKGVTLPLLVIDA